MGEKNIGGQKNLGIPKKGRQKIFVEMWPKNNDFRHISEKYRLEQSFLGLQSLKNKV